MPRAPLAVRVSPLKFTLAKGVLDTVQHVTVTNAGTDPITVHSSAMTVLQAHGGCGTVPAPDWVTVSAIGELSPGQSRVATITVHAPQGYDGDVAGVFTAVGHSPAHGSGGTLEASVGAQVVIDATGTGTAPVCVPPRALPRPRNGTDTTLIAGLVLAGAVLCAVALVLLLSYRRRAGQS
jgi:hypothetical protein